MSHLQPPPNFVTHNPNSSMPPATGQILPPPLAAPAAQNIPPPDASQVLAKYYDLPAGLIVPLIKVT